MALGDLYVRGSFFLLFLCDYKKKKTAELSLGRSYI